jgi:hypothetical protein
MSNLRIAGIVTCILMGLISPIPLYIKKERTYKRRSYGKLTMYTRR